VNKPGGDVDKVTLFFLQKVQPLHTKRQNIREKKKKTQRQKIRKSKHKIRRSIDQSINQSGKKRSFLDDRQDSRPSSAPLSSAPDETFGFEADVARELDGALRRSDADCHELDARFLEPGHRLPLEGRRQLLTEESSVRTQEHGDASLRRLPE